MSEVELLRYPKKGMAQQGNVSIAWMKLQPSQNPLIQRISSSYVQGAGTLSDCVQAFPKAPAIMSSR